MDRSPYNRNGQYSSGRSSYSEVNGRKNSGRNVNYRSSSNNNQRRPRDNEYDRRRRQNDRAPERRPSRPSRPDYSAPNTRRAERNSRDAQRRRERERIRARNQKILALLMLVVCVVLIIVIVTGIKSVVAKLKADKPQDTISNTISENGDYQEPQTQIILNPTPAPEKDISGMDIKAYDSYVVVGNSGYEYVKFNNDCATATINALNKGAENISGADIYTMFVPTSIDIMLPLTFLNNYADKTSDQKKTEQYILASLSDKIKKVPVYETLKVHCNEDIYFTSDNHISPLGAYYIYEQWALEKGFEPFDLYSCPQQSIELTGNIYTKDYDSALSGGDIMTVYKPSADFSYEYMEDDGSMSYGDVYYDVSSLDSSQAYKTFLHGSHYYGVITNNSITEDSKAIVVIDSNGTAIAPYIATHYNETYVIDYRIYSGTIPSLLKSTGAKDVIFCLSTNCVQYDSLPSGLSYVCG